MGITKAAHLERADLLLSLNKLQPALLDVNEALKYSQGSAEYKVRGDVYMGLGKYKEAVADYTDAIKRGAPDALLYKMRAAAYDKLGETKLAQQDRNLIRRLDD
jgi:tetratricopeptide (TPR) repeat protein